MLRRGLGGSANVEALLRVSRPVPRQSFLDEVKACLTRPPSRPFAWSRVAFASALTTVMLGAFAAFGGLSYAADKVDDGATAVKEALTSESARQSQRSPAADQYVPPPPPSPGGGVSGESGSGGASPAGQVSGELPFTGFPLLATAGIGFALLLVGLLLRRRELRA